MRPRVVLHSAVSINGRMDWIEPDLGLYYELAARLDEDATLCGADTLLAATAGQPEDTVGPDVLVWAKPADTRPLLVATDSQGRLRCWALLLASGYWRGGISLICKETPPEHLDYLKAIGVEVVVAGQERVELRAALSILAKRYGVQRIRVDSGWTLNGALLRAGLVDEVSLLLEPCLVGGEGARSLFWGSELAGPPAIALTLEQLERVGDGRVWLHYSVKAKEPLE